MQLSDLVTGGVWRRAATASPAIPELDTTASSAPASMTAWRRYRRLGWFLLKIVLRLLWWDLLLNRPILGWWRTSPQERWRQMAGEFRTLAIEMGGVLVKFGQFLSLRSDLLPSVVTQELAALQDQMPAAPLTLIVQMVETELGRSLGELFAWFAPHPVASASLAQVHQARLRSGEQVVVKVLRPGVCAQVEMDLYVITWLLNALKLFPRLRQAFDVDRVLEEFMCVSRRELDLRSEGKNAERFAQDFAADSQLYIPKVHWGHSGQQTLTLEDVGYFKINALEALDGAGIDRRQVAHQVASIFLRQIFVTRFIHADPHPGNLFIKPLPHPAELRDDFAPGEPVPYQAGRPFQIVLIDFGMATAIPPQAQAWLQEFLIGLGTRNAQRIVQSYVTGGLLRPGVDPQRVEQMTAVLLAHYQESLIGLMPDLQQLRTSHFFTEYADLIQNYPFQIPLDLLFMYRTLGLIGSVVKQLDPDFDLSTAAAPLARQLLWQAWQQDWQTRWQALTTLGQLLATPSAPPEQVVAQVQKVFYPPDVVRQWITVLRPAPNGPTIDPNTEQRRTIHQVEKSVKQLTWLVLALCLLLASGFWAMRTVLSPTPQTGTTLDLVGSGLIMLALAMLLRTLSYPK